MQLFAGGVNIGDLNACAIEPQVTLLRQPKRGIGYGLKYVYPFETSFTVAGQEDAKIKMAAVEAALSAQNVAIEFRNDDGTLSQNSSASSPVAGSTIIVNPRCASWTWMRDAGAQFMSWRKLSGVFEWERHFLNPTDFLLEFYEKVTINNPPLGGRYVVNEAVNGVDAQSTPTVAKPKSTATQTGFAVGLTKYPDLNVIAPPIFGSGQPPLKDSVITLVTPESKGETLKREYRVEWSHTFESPTTLVGIPNVWA
jgi:hypothetical protein